MRFITHTACFCVALGAGLATSILFRGDIQTGGDSFAATQAQSPNANVNWPPTVGQSYPDLTLQDLDGRPVKLSDYRGNLLLIEPIGVACKACQAFAGGHQVGGLFGHKPQPGLNSIHEYVPQYGRGQSLDDEQIVSIQILFYGNDGRTAATLKEAQTWRSHFKPVSPKTVVLLADQSLVGRDTRMMIPGFHLVDRDFKLRCEAGNPPKSDLFRELIPMIKKLL